MKKAIRITFFFSCDQDQTKEAMLFYIHGIGKYTVFIAIIEENAGLTT